MLELLMPLVVADQEKGLGKQGSDATTLRTIFGAHCGRQDGDHEAVERDNTPPVQRLRPARLRQAERCRRLHPAEERASLSTLNIRCVGDGSERRQGVAKTTRPDIIAYMTSSCDVIAAAIKDAAFVETVGAIADRVSGALSAGHKVMIAGNGGSAADAQHIAGELVGRFQFDRPPVAALALSTDSSVLTAIGNDYGYPLIFERQVRGLGRPGDILVGMSTSGRSDNILRALVAARETGITAVGLTGGHGDEMARCCDICLRAPAPSTPLIQQLHLMAGHIICQLVEAQLFPKTDDA